MVFWFWEKGFGLREVAVEKHISSRRKMQEMFIHCFLVSAILTTLHWHYAAISANQAPGIKSDCHWGKWFWSSGRANKQKAIFFQSYGGKVLYIYEDRYCPNWPHPFPYRWPKNTTMEISSCDKKVVIPYMHLIVKSIWSENLVLPEPSRTVFDERI